MAQYPIPQFIESEGKIISFLTFRQFFILVGGGAILAALYYFLSFYVASGIGIFVTAVFLLVAFFKIDNQSVVSILLDFLKFTTGTKTYTWKKKTTSYAPAIKMNQEEAPKPHIQPTLKMQASKLRQIQKMIETKK